MYRLSFKIRCLTLFVYRFSCVVFRLSFTVYRLSFLGYHLSFIVHRLSFIVYRSLFVVYHLQQCRPTCFNGCLEKVGRRLLRVHSRPSFATRVFAIAPIRAQQQQQRWLQTDKRNNNNSRTRVRIQTRLDYI